jgi:4-hydroxybenzoate polyprenyltransferase
LEYSILKIARALLENMRPRQWTKNGFVFAGIVFDQKLLDLDSFVRVLTAFILLCMTASTIYLINDLVDIEKDRQHPKKRNRPLASGRLPLNVARIVALVLPVVAVAAAAVYSVPLAVVLIAYLVLHVAYSYWLKNIVILDVFAIAAGFVLRVIAGVVVIDLSNFSPWLYVIAGILSLFLAVGKRRQELVMMGEKAVQTREIFKEYTLRLLDDMLMLTLTSAAVSYTLYAIEAQSTSFVKPEYRLLTVPLVYYGLFRYMYVIHVKGHGGDPTDLIFEDRPLQIAFVSGVILLLILLYVV